jgi:hypothetical protein
MAQEELTMATPPSTASTARALCRPGPRPERQQGRASVRRLLPGLLCGALALIAPGLMVTATTAAAADAPAAAPAKPKAPGKPKSKSKGKRQKGTAATLSQMLTDKSSLVQDCAVQHGLDKGADRVDVATKVTINNRGQVISINTNVHLDKGDGGPKVKDCVDTLIRAISFPPSEAPLITIDRNWTVASK